MIVSSVFASSFISWHTSTNTNLASSLSFTKVEAHRESRRHGSFPLLVFRIIGFFPSLATVLREETLYHIQLDSFEP